MATTVKFFKNGSLLTSEITGLTVTDHYVAYELDKLAEKYHGKITAEVTTPEEKIKYSLSELNELIVESDILIFKNKHWTKRDYDCTNIVFCTGKEAPNENWDLSTKEHAADLRVNHLYTQNDIKYFGYL